MWKGEIRNGEKWNGKGFFEWKDEKDFTWKCEGNIFILSFNID